MDARFYGLYRGVCIDIDDPNKLNRITLQVPQVLGTQVTNWALPCTPVTDNANHPDHIAHTAAQVAALLNNHTDTYTSSGTTVGALGSHTHTITLASAHTGNSGTLKHPHVTLIDPLDKDGSEDGLTAAEHTYHRKVPNVGQQVWVMFVAGDPNFPVWMGV
jgi:Type VI secretion system/phage-baseplate injector OB domain